MELWVSSAISHSVAQEFASEMTPFDQKPQVSAARTWFRLVSTGQPERSVLELILGQPDTRDVLLQGARDEINNLTEGDPIRVRLALELERALTLVGATEVIRTPADQWLWLSTGPTFNDVRWWSAEPAGSGYAVTTVDYPGLRAANPGLFTPDLFGDRWPGATRDAMAAVAAPATDDPEFARWTAWQDDLSATGHLGDGATFEMRHGARATVTLAVPFGFAVEGWVDQMRRDKAPLNDAQRARLAVGGLVTQWMPRTDGSMSLYDVRIAPGAGGNTTSSSISVWAVNDPAAPEDGAAPDVDGRVLRATLSLLAGEIGRLHRESLDIEVAVAPGAAPRPTFGGTGLR